MQAQGWDAGVRLSVQLGSVALAAAAAAAAEHDDAVGVAEHPPSVSPRPQPHLSRQGHLDTQTTAPMGPRRMKKTKRWQQRLRRPRALRGSWPDERGPTWLARSCPVRGAIEHNRFSIRTDVCPRRTYLPVTFLGVLLLLLLPVRSSMGKMKDQ